ncbi:hypothetical protein SPKIRA_02180 [Sphingomonas paucimobilis]|uniref:DNA, contig: SP669 n=2 Tax=Sphingomonas paucimobilis TaxID=13689 RepID=A0A0C9N8X2_SPHPI|nr:hypothetical protein SPKIRA_02180 [Sphingomonas paucimobilis]GAN15849.1 hypothetical protein SP6_69_00090 [Sphingomonas paucimobilis NBRC 13935]
MRIPGISRLQIGEVAWCRTLPYRDGMNIGQLDAAIRAGAVGTILLLAWLLFSARRRVGLPAALFVPLALCLSGFLIGNTPVAALSPAGIAGAITHIASGFTVVFLWWFCLSCFDSRFRLGGGVLGVCLTWAAIATVDRGVLGAALADKGWKRYGPSLPNWLTSRKDDGGEMAPLPSGPKPTPMVGGAEVTSE